jgi:uncharacterized damage-inducible protein DinB
MHVHYMQLLYEFNTWANHRILDACGALTAEQFTKDLGSSFPSVRDTLGHIYGAEWIWLERWNGRTPTGGLPKAADFPDLASLRTRWAEHERALDAFVSGLDNDKLNAELETRTLDGTPYKQPLWQMMQHVVNHGSYHRGQVTAFLRQLGHKAVATDLIRFYRERSAAAKA